MMFAVTTLNPEWYKALVHIIPPLPQTQTNDKIHLMIQFPRNCNQTGRVANRSTPY